ncbi:MAG: shikimate dehydrogenase [bacterium]
MTTITAQTRLTGLIGHPVAHSLSPAMHNTEFERLGLNYIYMAWDVAPGLVGNAVNGLVALNAAGFNVTIPHKQCVMQFLDEISPDALLIGAVNTVTIIGGKTCGCNTDAQGWLDDISQDISLAGRTICVLGAGGAARAVCAASGRAGVRKILIGCQPSDAKPSEDLASGMASHFRKLDREWMSFDNPAFPAALRECDIVVNATPVGMERGTPIPPMWLCAKHYVYDVIYNRGETELLSHARKLGCATRNGLGMLARQGARAFELWTAVKPDACRMEEILRRHF